MDNIYQLSGKSIIACGGQRTSMMEIAKKAVKHFNDNAHQHYLVIKNATLFLSPLFHLLLINEDFEFTPVDCDDDWLHVRNFHSFPDIDRFIDFVKRVFGAIIVYKDSIFYMRKSGFAIGQINTKSDHTTLYYSYPKLYYWMYEYNILCTISGEYQDNFNEFVRKIHKIEGEIIQHQIAD